MADLNLTADVIDVRDIIARIEEIEAGLTDEIEGDDQIDEMGDVIERMAECGTCGFVWNDARISGITPAPSARCPVEDEHEERAELASLLAIMRDMQGYGGDEQWRGEWYPVTLIDDVYFEDYARELAEDIGAIDKDASWPNTYIDWEAAATALRQDYTSTEIEGRTYWYR
jgi:hypothetical protein